MYTLAKETKTGFRKQGSASQKKRAVFLIGNLSLLSEDFPVTGSARDGSDSSFVLPSLRTVEHICACCEGACRRRLHFCLVSVFPLCSLGWDLRPLKISLPSAWCGKLCRTCAAAQPPPAILGCSPSCSRWRQKQLLLVQLCNQWCILWPSSFLTARAIFISQGNALCKAIVPCSVSTDGTGLCRQHPMCGVNPPRSFLAPVRARPFCSFLDFASAQN